MFACEKIFGYKNPTIALSYEEPTLAMSLQASWESTLEPDKAAGSEADSVAACLKIAMSDGLLTAAETAEAVAAPTKRVDGTVVAGARIGFACSEPAPSELLLPPGVCVATYHQDAGPVPASASAAAAIASPARACFVIHRWRPAESVALQQYHDRMATLAAWTIETASPIDCTDPKWTVYGVYERVLDASGSMPGGVDSLSAGGGYHHHLVGYSTTYLFTNPFAKGRPHTLRLAQLVILPRYQRQNHGLRMLAAIHADAAGHSEVPPGPLCLSNPSSSAIVSSGAAAAPAPSSAIAADSEGACSEVAATAVRLGLDAAEVSVESPCEGMQALRDVCDTAHAAACGAFAARLGNISGLRLAVPLPYLNLAGAVADAATAARQLAFAAAALPAASIVHLTDDREIQAARDTLRTPVSQVHRAYECLLYSRIDRGNEDNVRCFRLAVKRRVYETDDDIAAVSDAELRKQHLELAFQRCLGEYAAVLAKLGLLTPTEAAATRKAASEAVARLEDALDAGSEAGEEAQPAAAGASS
jgi:hypothetical protein